MKISVHTAHLCVPDWTVSLRLHETSALSTFLVAMVMDRLAGEVRRDSGG